MLRDWDFEVEEVAEAEGEGEKRPDLVAVDRQRRYIIEIKRRLGSKAVEKEWRAKLDRGEVGERAVSHTRNRTVAANSRKAASQIEALATGEDLRLVWHVALGREANALFEQIEASLCGRRGVVGSDSLPRILCYYFTHSDFFTRREKLDGAIVSTQEEHKLCINTYSERVNLLRSSRLAERFANAILDPVALEKDGHCYVADCTVDRSDEQAVLGYLCEKYEREHLMPLDLGTLSTTLLVDNADSDAR